MPTVASLHHTLRQVRSRFIPSHIRTCFELRRTHGWQSVDARRKVVFFDFSNVEIDAVSGRYLFSLVCDFEALGLLPCFRDNFTFLATMRYKPYKRLLLERDFRVCRSVADIPAAALAGVVTDRLGQYPQPRCPLVVVRYEHTWPQHAGEMPMSFFVNPSLHDVLQKSSAPDLERMRPWRIFFAGATQEALYTSDILPRRFGKMSRAQMLAAIEAELPPEKLLRLRSREQLGANLDGSAALVWAEGPGARVPKSEWLATLARTDFFLACPGKEMPLCHNLVEALAMGTVPLLEHPEYLDPPLRDGVNSLVFRGRAELLATVRRALAMNPAEVLSLRRAALAHYEKHLKAGRLADRLLGAQSGRVELLFNSCRTPRPATGAT